MGTVDIGIGHDDDLVIAEVFAPVFVAQPTTERLNKVFQFLIGVNLVIGCGGDVKDFSAKRQDRLRFTVTALFGGAASTITLDYEYLSTFASALAAVSQLAGKAKTACRRFTAGFLFLSAAEAFL